MIIELYSTPSCGKCMLVKSMLEDNVSYKSINDTKLVLKKSTELGLLSMPILIIDGKPYSGRGAVIKAKELVGGVGA
jgi:glutaredoxin